ncbi:MAG TPA: hypothetical protein VIQ30_02570 [Pseudonocardia sp.]
MTLNVFSAGNFSAWSPLVEWDGSNEADIAAWICGLDPQNDPVTSANNWGVSSATTGEVVFTRPATHPASGGSALDVHVPLHGWLTAVLPVNFPTTLFVQPVDPAGKWKTTDPYGRPNTAGDLLA